MARWRWRGGAAADDGADAPAALQASGAGRTRLRPAAGRIRGLEIRHAGGAARTAVHANYLRSRRGHDTRDFPRWEAAGVRLRPRRGPQPGPLCAATPGSKVIGMY